jgi:hypothetical protein
MNAGAGRFRVRGGRSPVDAPADDWIFAKAIRTRRTESEDGSDHVHWRHPGRE